MREEREALGVRGEKQGRTGFNQQRNHQRGNIGEEYKNLRKELFSIFVDNIPVGKEVDWVRALFSKDGKALDVFIPSRVRRASNSRFEFVRYKTLGEAMASIRRWNGANVGKAKLLVSLADRGGKPKEGVRNDYRRVTRPAGDLRKGVEAPAGRPRFAGRVGAADGRKSVNVASNGQNSQRRRVKMESFMEYEEWASKSLVADLKHFKLGEAVEKELRADGIAHIKVIPMEGMQVMIQFATVEDLERCLTEEFGAVLRNFSKMQRWRVELTPKTRSVWISILGLPFRAWTEMNGERLAAPHGKFLKMDDRDVRFVGAGRARMLIETRKIERIYETIEAEISGEVFVVSLCEDCCLGGCGIDTPDSLSQSGVGVDLSKSGASSSVVRRAGLAPGGLGVGQGMVEAASVGGSLEGGPGAAATSLQGMPERGRARAVTGNSEIEEFSNFEPLGENSDIAESISPISDESIQVVQETIVKI